MKWSDVSIIIPARDAEDTIGATLDTISAQDYDGSIEVVVADGSGDGSMRTLIWTRFPMVRVVPNLQRITPCGLNRAIQASTGEIIVRCDAHAILPPTYVRDVVLLLEKTGAACVGGMQVPRGDNCFGRAVSIAMTSPLGSGNSRYKVGGKAGPTDTVYLGAWRRETLDTVGGFDETMVRNQDYELNWRLRQAGGMVWLDPTLKVGYLPRNSIKSLAKQHFDYGRWKLRMLRKNPRSVKVRQLLLPTILLGLLASAGWMVFGCPRWAGLVFPLGYLSAFAVGAVVHGLRRREPAAMLLPLALATMHLSWASGFFISALRLK